MKNKTIKNLLLSILLLFCVCTFPSNAQPGFDDDVEDTPLDSNIYLLSIAALCLGSFSYKIKNSNKPA